MPVFGVPAITIPLQENGGESCAPKRAPGSPDCIIPPAFEGVDEQIPLA
jgi:hypothetical protein